MAGAGANIGLIQSHFDDLLSRRGRHILWQQAQRCTCWNPHSGQPGYDCLACSGLGYVYDSPGIEETSVLLVSMVLNRDNPQNIGEERLGDCILTVPYKKLLMGQGIKRYEPVPAYWIGEYDRVIVLDTEFKTSEVLVRGEEIFGGKRISDSLRNEFVTKIIRILKSNSGTGEITYYSEGEDYQLSNNKIEWNEDMGPEEGEKYSVLYLHRPTYIVYAQLPQPRNQDNQVFPRKVVLRHREIH